MIYFSHPAWLAALVLAPIAAWLRLRPQAPAEAAWPSALTRGALLALLTLALAGLHLRRQPKDFTTIFLVDRSLSVPIEEQDRAWGWIEDALAKAKPSDRAGAVLFGSDAAVESVPEPGLRLRKPEAVVGREATDVAEGLRLAAALLPSDGGGRIVLLSDGRETGGDMLAEGLRLAAEGVPLDVVPLAASSSADLIARRLDAPGAVAAREAVELRAELWASGAMPVRARLFRDRQLLLTREVEVPAGKSELSFADRLEEPGLHEYRLYFDGPKDRRPENNEVAAVVEVQGPPTVLLVEEPGASPLRKLLGEAGIRVRSVGRGGFPRSLPELGAYSAILLDNIPAYGLPSRSQAELKAAVGDLGGGLALFGGDRSFGAGGYQGTPVEEALPVSMEVKRPGLDLSLAIVIVMDRSGSMAVTAGGSQKIEIAAEGAMRVVEMLGPRQSIGVCAVDTAPEWIVPLQLADKKAEIIEAIGRLRAGGGGIYVYTALVAAREELAKVKASVRHVVLFSDAADSEEQVQGGRSALDLIGQMAAEGITVSVIALGQPHNKDAAFLEQAAGRGQGRHYMTDDIRNVPSILIREGLLARRAAFVEEPFLAKPKAELELMRGIDWDKAPELTGYVLAQPKDAAQVGLLSHRGDPVLAAWRFGLGRSLAFTSDVRGRWSSDWADWPGAGRLWTQAARWLARPPSSEGLTVRVESRGAEALIEAEAAGPQGEPLNFLTLEGDWIDPDLKKTSVRLEQRGPGRYSAVVPARGSGTYTVRVQSSGEAALSRTAHLVVPYPLEFSHHSADLPRLARLSELTGGYWDPKPEQAFRRADAASRRLVDLSPLLLLLCALLLPLDVALRRVRVNAHLLKPARDKTAAAWAAVRGRARAVLPRRWASGEEDFSAPPSELEAGKPAPSVEASPPPPPDAWERLKEARKRARKK